MRKYFTNPIPLLKRATQIALGLIICWGFIQVLAEIDPFWMDEWRLLYSLKFKTAGSLFGPLFYTQQFPRVYLVLLKAFTSALDYSYFSLRLPAFIVGVCSIILGYRVMNRIYDPGQPNRYLFLLILFSSPIFTQYLVQIKQYEMEIFASIAGIAQLLYLVEIGRTGLQNKGRYVGLCLSFIIAPFFSYTYPIVIAPVFLLVFIQGVRLLRSEIPIAERRKLLLQQWTPLVLGMLSIAAFYVIDVSQVVNDTAMQCFWHYNLMRGPNATLDSFFRNTWEFFGSPGSGYLYQRIFSCLAIAALLFAYAKSGRLFRGSKDAGELVCHYAVLLVSLVIILFLAGKLPLGEGRLNVFTFPSIAILIIHLLSRLRSGRTAKLSTGLSIILYVGLLGNVVTTILNSFTSEKYAKTYKIYKTTEHAIIYAREHKLPIVVSPGIAYPSNILHDDTCMEPIDAASILRTYPAYKEREKMLVVSDNDSAYFRKNELPSGIDRALVGNGMDYKVVDRQTPGEGEHL